MKIYLTFLSLCFFSILGFSQIQLVEEGNLSIEYIKGKKVSKIISLNSSSKIKSKELRKISIKCKIRSLNGEKVDINKISLVDHKNKIRYRPTDISFQPVVFYMVYLRLLKDNINLGNWSKSQLGVTYDPDIKDSFKDYSIPGYTEIEIPITFATGIGKKEYSVLYFAPHKYKKFQALIFFAIIKNAKNQKLEFYYGDNKLADVEL